MSEMKEEVLEKIKKLLALAERAGSEEEADTANQRIHAILAKHNLSMNDVLNSSHEQEKAEQDFHIERYSEAWRRTIMQAAARLYFCNYLYSDTYLDGVNSTKRQKGVKHIFIGKKHNIIVAMMMGQYLVGTVNRLANEGARTELQSKLGRQPTSTERGRFVNSFRLAAAMRLQRRLDDLRRKAMQGEETDETGTKLPALLSLYEQEDLLNKQFQDSIYPKTVNRKQSAGITDQAGARAGRNAADNINMSSQVGHSQTGKLSGPTHLLGKPGGLK